MLTAQSAAAIASEWLHYWMMLPWFHEFADDSENLSAWNTIRGIVISYLQHPTGPYLNSLHDHSIGYPYNTRNIYNYSWVGGFRFWIRQISSVHVATPSYYNVLVALAPSISGTLYSRWYTQSVGPNDTLTAQFLCNPDLLNYLVIFRKYGTTPGYPSRSPIVVWHRAHL